MARGMDNTSASILAFILTGGLFGAVIGGASYVQAPKKPSDKMTMDASNEDIEEPFDNSQDNSGTIINADDDHNENSDDDHESYSDKDSKKN